MIGTKLAHYEITSHLGSGGMGDVYQATDTKLGRSVAIKFLPEAFSHDTERVARFQREARVLASLNHSNIAGIHGLEEIDKRHFLVMELVPGETLADRIKRGAIPLAEAVPIARQIADALEAAHEQGIIHRDLKPANVKVREDGTVKVLDFGLAKAIEPAGTTPSASQSPTVTTPAMTQQGIILGTASYMPPEQARGKRVDKRSDIWAFGCVIYEMLTGRRAFDGEDVSDTLANVLKSTPDWSALPAGVPAAVRAVVTMCLEKDRQQRMADISVAQFLLRGQNHVALAGVAPQTPSRRRLALYGLLALFAGAIVAGAGAWLAMRQAPPRTVRLMIPPSSTAPLRDRTLFRSNAITRDGTRIVYLGPGGTLFVRSLDQLDPTPIPGLGLVVNDVF